MPCWKRLKTTKRDCLIPNLDNIKEILGLLNKENLFILKNRGIIFVGKKMEDVEKSILDLLEE